jgi:iron-sulfur cluster assembly protein|nr:MAG: iron-sulfur-binding protein [Bacteroidota bacterium]
MITLSERAAAQIRRIRDKEGKGPEYGIRIRITGGGCAGLTYQLEFEREAGPEDQVFEDKGIRIFVDFRSFLYLAGSELDFTDGLDGKGFHFRNPNASRTCACGESFAV